MNNIRLYNLGVKRIISSHQVVKKVAWPIYAWQCILPLQATRELDVLQQLVMNLIDMNQLDNELMEQKLGFSLDLIDSVLEKCKEEGYLTDDRQLTAEGKIKLQNENQKTLDFENVKNCEKVWLLRDGLSGDIIPNFSKDEIPHGYISDVELTIRPYSKFRKKPEVPDIEEALKMTRKLRRFIAEKQQTYGCEEVEISLQFEQELQDEVDWEDINDEGDIEVASAQEINEDTVKEANPAQSPTNIKIWDEEPQLIYVETYIYVDVDKPNEWQVRSPLGAQEDSWFGRRLGNVYHMSEEIKEEMDFFLEEAREELKKKYPLDNDLNIELINQFPKVANKEEFKYLKEELESVKRAELRISEGDEDYDTLFMRCQRVLECLFELTIERILNREEIIKHIIRSDFRNQVQRIANEIGIKVPGNFMSKKICRNLLQMSHINTGSIKDKALFLLFDAYYNDNSVSINLLKSMPDFYEHINTVANNRNNKVHFSKEENNATSLMLISKQIMDSFETLTNVIFSHFFRGE